MSMRAIFSRGTFRFFQSGLLTRRAFTDQSTVSTVVSYSHPNVESKTEFSLLLKEAKSSLSTLRDVIRFMASRLTKSNVSFGHGTEDPYEEAVFLACFATRLTPALMESMADAKLCPKEIEEILNLLQTRISQRIPAAYLTKSSVLNEHVFYVNSDVLIPRSLISEVLPNLAVSKPSKILDLCTGSGCLAILAAEQFPEAQVDAVDICNKALKVAKQNVRDYNLENRITLLKSDMLDGVPKVQYDLIICNPPYIASSEMKNLPREYQREPKKALDGGADGMQFIHVLLRQAYGFLSESGVLVLEIGGLKDVLEKEYPTLPFQYMETSKGNEFVVTLNKKEFESIEKGKKIYFEKEIPKEDPDFRFFTDPTKLKSDGIQTKQKKNKRDKK